jgi:hypothetical protein
MFSMRLAPVLLIMAILLYGCLADSGRPQDNVTDDDGTSIINDSTIQSFEDCVAAGYPVMESYPRQCRTADGRTFISLTDLFDSSKDTSCIKDEDCTLVDEELAFSCCWAGACREINYSEGKWIAVNNDWFEQQRLRHCTADCGPAPLCAVRVKNDNFTASCVEGMCKKLPIQAENVTVNETFNESVKGIPEDSQDGTLFGDGKYLLVLEDVVLPRYDATCGAFSVQYAENSSELTKLLICEGKSQYWVSPDGYEYRIKVVAVAAGYSANARWADVRIYG